MLQRSLPLLGTIPDAAWFSIEVAEDISLIHWVLINIGRLVGRLTEIHYSISQVPFCTNRGMLDEFSCLFT